MLLNILITLAVVIGLVFVVLVVVGGPGRRRRGGPSDSEKDSYHKGAGGDSTRILLIATTAAAMAIGAAQSNSVHAFSPEEGDTDLVFEVDHANRLAPLDDPPNLETPYSSLDSFIVAGREEDWARAARSLDFRLMPDIDEKEAANLARRLFFVLNQELWIDWSMIPARADGMLDETSIGASSRPFLGEPRRGILLGRIEIEDRKVPVRIHRVRVGEDEPVWLFSAHTVTQIDRLYEAHGPSWLARAMPEWARVRHFARTPLWQWIALLVAVILSLLLGVLLGPVLLSVFASRELIGQDRAESFRFPIAATVSTMVLGLTVEWLLGFPGAVASLVETSILILFMVSITWLATRVTSRVFDAVARDVVDGFHGPDAPERQKVLTQVSVARHVIILIVAMIAVGVFLHQMDLFRTAAVALLTSAGAAAVLIGIAGHAVLGNLIAGVQIAVTQPFQIGDAVYVLDDWGRIESIAYTYVTVKTWDERRLVIPIRHFVTEPIENWSKNDAFLVKPIYLYVDFSADVSRIREKFFEILEQQGDWDRERDEPEVLVTEVREQCMQVRLTCGAKNPSMAWNLFCRVQEKMMAWLRESDDGSFLPRRRLQFESIPDALSA